MPVPLLYIAGGSLLGFVGSDGVEKINKTILYGIAGLILYKVVK